LPFRSGDETPQYFRHEPLDQFKNPLSLRSCRTIPLSSECRSVNRDDILFLSDHDRLLSQAPLHNGLRSAPVPRRMGTPCSEGPREFDRAGDPIGRVCSFEEEPVLPETDLNDADPFDCYISKSFNINRLPVETPLASH
jgi:hypothetical protein